MSDWSMAFAEAARSALSTLSALHFLRPHWLWGLAIAALLYGFILFRQDAERYWRQLIPAHLVAHLIVRPPRRMRPGPRAWLCLMLATASLALSGPAWQREPSPFVSDKAPLIIALHLGTSMDATDVQPTRLIRAQQKLRDLLQLRRGAKTALIVYGQTAHRVLPLTDDPTFLASYLATLQTDVLPPGSPRLATSALGQVTSLAKRMLDEEGTPGSLLLVTDTAPAWSSVEPLPGSLILWTFGTEQGGSLRRSDGGIVVATNGVPVISRLDHQALSRFADEHALPWIKAGIGDADIQEVNFRIQTQLEQSARQSDQQRWQDNGHWLLWPLSLMLALSFRRGWVVRWQ